MKAISYLRVSGHGQISGDGFPRQREAIARYAAANGIGIDVRVSQFLPTYRTVQFRFPRSKKIRMRRKWAKQPRNFKMVTDTHCYRIGNFYIVSPQMYQQLQENIRKDK